MAELDRLDAAYGLGAMPQPLPRRRGHSTTALAVLLTVVVLSAVVLLHPSSEMQAVRRMVGLEDARILAAPSGEGRGGAYAFTMTQRGSDKPVGWDPCQPIRYQINPTGGADDGTDLIERALVRASAASGLAFADEGFTDDRPFTEQLVPAGTDRPVVIGWGDADEFTSLAGNVAGIGGGAAEEGVLGRRYLVTGSVALDTDVFTAEAFARRPQVLEAIVLHEVAHVLGLHHVDDPGQLMAAENTGQVDFGAGDLEGLARLGSLPCA